jgi:hypothetical protein
MAQRRGGGPGGGRRFGEPCSLRPFGGPRSDRLGTIRNADRIRVGEGGEIVEQGVVRALLCRGGRYAALSRRQFRDLAPTRDRMRRPSRDNDGAASRARRPCRERINRRGELRAGAEHGWDDGDGDGPDERDDHGVIARDNHGAGDLLGDGEPVWGDADQRADGEGTATSFVVNSDTNITVITPAHGAGTVDVTVTTAVHGTTASRAFTYVDMGA